MNFPRTGEDRQEPGAQSSWMRPEGCFHQNGVLLEATQSCKGVRGVESPREAHISTTCGGPIGPQRANYRANRAWTGSEPEKSSQQATLKIFAKTSGGGGTLWGAF